MRRRAFPRKRKRTYRRSSYKKKRRTSKRSMGPVGGFKPTQWVRMKYADIEELVGTSLSYATRVYRGNSIYDPDYSGTTQNSCAMYSTWANLYNRYNVSACSIRVTFQATTNVPLWCYVYAYNSVSAPVAPPDWQDLPGCKKVLLQGMSAGNATSKTIKMYRRSRTIHGMSYLDPDAGAVMAGSPTIQWFYLIAIETFDASVGPHCLINVELIYKTRFSGRKQYF